jgi:hypothetical protein
MKHKMHPKLAERIGAYKARYAKRRSLERVVRARSDDFERYWKTWMTTYGHAEASRWMALHIGGLVGEIEQLKRRVSMLERKSPNH